MAASHAVTASARRPTSRRADGLIPQETAAAGVMTPAAAG